MGAKGITIAEELHVVNILPPIDVDTASGADMDVFSMENYAHATIIIQTGVTNATPGTITVKECDDFTPSNSTAIAFAYYEETTAAGDTLGARTAATTSGFALSANDNCTYVIEIDAAELSDGYPCIQVSWSNPGGSTIGSAVAILSGPRYAGDQSDTAIA
jgi:hypothetical protein